MSQMIFYKYPLEQDEIWDGTPTGSTYAWGVANPDLFNDMPDDIEIYLDDDTDQWVAVSSGAVIDGPYPSVNELMDSLSTMYGADSYEQSEDGYDEAQSELVVASFDGIPMTTKDVYTARAEYGVDVDVRTRTVAGTRENVGRWRRAMAYNVRRTAADAGWAEISAGIWEYQDGREQAYIMDANDGLLHLYYEGLDYGPYEDELMAMDVFAQLVPGIDDSIDDALAIAPPLGQMLSTSDSYDTDNGMLDDDWEDDFDADEFDPDDDWGFHDVSDYDDDYDDEDDDEDDSRTASVHTAYLSARDIRDLFSGIDGVDVHDGTVSYGGREYDADELYDDMSALYDEEEVSPNAQPFDDYVRENLTDWLDAKAASSTASVHTAGAWTIDADAPLDNDQKRMLNDAGVAFSQDETDDGKARITLTGTDKVVADTAEMIGLTDDFVNDAEPLDGVERDPDDEESPEDEVRDEIDDAVESDGDDMHAVSDDDQKKIVDGVKNLLEGWKDDVSDRSAMKTAEAPGADGTDMSEMPVDEHWPYRFESRKVDVDNGRFVSATSMTADGSEDGYSELLDEWPEFFDKYDGDWGYADGPDKAQEAYYEMVHTEAGDLAWKKRIDMDQAIREVEDFGEPELNIRYPSDESESQLYWEPYDGRYVCENDRFITKSYDEAMDHLRNHAEDAYRAKHGDSASTRTAHQLQSFSINTENHGPVTVDVDMGQQYDNGSTAYTVSIDGIPSAKDGFELSYYGYLSNDTVDDDYEEWSWNVSGSDGETIYDDGRELSGEADSREGAESDMYDAMFDYFNRNLERDIDSYLSDNGLTASARGTAKRADTEPKSWTFDVDGVGSVSATVSDSGFGGTRQYSFTFGGALDDYGKDGFRPVVLGEIEDMSWDNDGPTFEWRLSDEDHNVDEYGDAESMEDAEHDMMAAFESFIASDACADMIRGYVDANR